MEKYDDEEMKKMVELYRKAEITWLKKLVENMLPEAKPWGEPESKDYDYSGLNTLNPG